MVRGLKEAKEIIHQAKAITNCPNCKFHKDAIVACAKNLHRHEAPSETV